jgi:hypothetical protein
MNAVVAKHSFLATVPSHKYFNGSLNTFGRNTFVVVSDTTKRKRRKR